MVECSQLKDSTQRGWVHHQVRGMGVVGAGGAGGEKEKELLYSPRIILAWAWDQPSASSKWPINFTRFCRLWMGPHPQVCLTDRCGPEPLQPQQSGTEEGKGRVTDNSLGRAQCGVPEVWKAVAFWWSKQSHASHFIKLSVDFPFLDYIFYTIYMF